MSLYKHMAGYDVMAWSVSGNETCVAVRKGNFSIGFDVGFSPRDLVYCDTIFISHGHIDHIGCLPQHARKRQLIHLPPAKYFVPLTIVEPLKEICRLFAKIHGEGAESLNTLEIIGVEAGQKINLNNQWCLEVFATAHRIDSIGCLVSRTTRQLLADYVGRPHEEIRELIRSGVNVNRETLSPEIAYLGDTDFSVFLTPAHPNLLQCRLIITEMTYLDQPARRLSLAKEYGHSHIVQLAQNWQLFDEVDKLVLIHFSDRYSAGEIIKLVKSSLPPQMRGKVYCATLAKDALTLAAQRL